MTIIKWTIGNVSDKGFSCLKKSIQSFVNVYGDNFEFFVCYNNIQKSKLNKLKELNVKVNLLEQKKIFLGEGNSFWKYSPPRIDINQKELWIDNDIIFFKKTSEIEFFLSNDCFLICRDHCRYFGVFDHLLPFPINAGIMGLPPKYNFKYEALKIWNDFGCPKLTTSADEQGLSAFVFLKNNAIIVPTTKIQILHDKGIPLKCFSEWQLFSWDSEAIHFVGLNYKQHPYYEYYAKKL